MSELEGSNPAVNILQTGNYVIYTPTGTKGIITDIMKDEEGTWALLDKTNLYYKIEVLTPIKPMEEKILEEKTFTRDEVNEKLEKQKEFVPTEMDHSNVESGG